MPATTDPAPETPTPLVGRTLDGRYQLVSLIGRGGMGSVYLADDVRMGRKVVVKFPHARFLEEDGFRARFEHEIRALIDLEHPHIVKGLDAGTIEGVPYAVLQYLAGGSLHDRLKAAGGRVDVANVERWLPPVAHALDAVHADGVVHRDVKPGNILFDKRGEVFLADFGIAKVLGASDTGLTQSGATPGSPDYMAPELLTSGTLSPAYDQYALAVVVYEALAGRLPHVGLDGPMQVLYRKAESDPPDIRMFVPDLPSGPASAVMRALARYPEIRFSSCSAFAEAFSTRVPVQSPDVAIDPEPSRLRVDGVPRHRRLTRAAKQRNGSSASRPKVGRHWGLLGLALGTSAALLAWFGGLISPAADPDGLSVALGRVGVVSEPNRATEPNAPGVGDRDHTPPTLTVETDTVVDPTTGRAVIKGRATDNRAIARVLVDGAVVMTGVAPDGGFRQEIGLEPGQQRDVAIVAIDVDGNSSETVVRRVSRPALAPAWRGSMDAALALSGASPPDWDRASQLYAEAVAAGLPASEVPQRFADGLGRWRAPVTLLIASPADGTVSRDPEANLEIRVGTQRSEDELWVRGQRAGAGEGVSSHTVELQEGENPIEVEVRDSTGTVRARAKVRIQYSRVGAFLGGWARPEGDARDQNTGLPRRIRRVRDGMIMILVDPGTFQMGEPGEDNQGKPTSVPITLTEPYYLDEHEVTVRQYGAFVTASSYVPRDDGMPEPVERERSEEGAPLPFTFRTWRSGDGERKEASLDLPVDGLAWDDAVAYARWAGVSLPTEAQWERAARGDGAPTRYAWGESPWPTAAIANLGEAEDPATKRGFDDGVPSARAPVKSFPPSRWGFHDLIGNVSEWCLDVAVEDPASFGRRTDPRGPSVGLTHVQRGSDFRRRPDQATIATRRTNARWGHLEATGGGFRCAATVRAEGRGWKVDDRIPTNLEVSLASVAAGLVDAAELAELPSVLGRLRSVLRLSERTDGVDLGALQILDEIGTAWSLLANRKASRPESSSRPSWRLQIPRDAEYTLGRHAAEVLSSVRDPSGVSVDWNALRGDVVVIAAWSLNCATCTRLDADFRDVLERVGRPSEVKTWIEYFFDSGASKEGVDRARTRAAEYLRATGFGPSIWTEADRSGDLAHHPTVVALLRFNSTHATAVVGRDGRISSLGLQGPLLEFAIRHALAQPVPPTLPTKPSWARTAADQDAAAAELGLPVAFENAIGQRFVLIPPGSAQLGGTHPGGAGVGPSDRPPVTVKMEHPYYVAEAELTNAQFRRFAPAHRLGRQSHPSAAGPLGDEATVVGLLDEANQPAAGIPYATALKFAAWLSSGDKQWIYRLPTEDEWEFAASAGSDVPTDWGDDPYLAGRFGKFGAAGSGATDFKQFFPVMVGGFAPTRFGLFDMAGNVAEWTSTSSSDGGRILKGGCWAYDPRLLGGRGPWDRTAWDGNATLIYAGIRLVAEPRKGR